MTDCDLCEKLIPDDENPNHSYYHRACAEIGWSRIKNSMCQYCNEKPLVNTNATKCEDCITSPNRKGYPGQ